MVLLFAGGAQRSRTGVGVFDNVDERRSATLLPLPSDENTSTDWML